VVRAWRLWTIQAHRNAPYGINKFGQVVGYYYDSTGIHGFIRTGGAFAPLDFPGAPQTLARGIDDSAGWLATTLIWRDYTRFYQNRRQLDSHGFSGREVLSYYSVNNIGQAVGSYDDSAGTIISSWPMCLEAFPPLFTTA